MVIKSTRRAFGLSKTISTYQGFAEVTDTNENIELVPQKRASNLETAHHGQQAIASRTEMSVEHIPYKNSSKSEFRQYGVDGVY